MTPTEREQQDRLYYTGMYLDRLGTDPDWFATMGCNQIGNGMRILIDKYPHATKCNELAEQIIESASGRFNFEATTDGLMALRDLALRG